YPIDRAPCLGRLVPPAIQQLEQRRLIRPEFLQRLPVDPRNDTGDQPDRLAHLNDGDQCAILIQSGERSAQVIRLRHGAPRRLFPATMMPCPRRSPHSISCKSPLAPRPRPPNPRGRLILRQFLQTAPDRARRHAGRHRHRGNATISHGKCFRGRDQTTAPFIQKRRHRQKPLSNGLDIDHNHHIWYETTVVNSILTLSEVDSIISGRALSDKPSTKPGQRHPTGSRPAMPRWRSRPWACSTASETRASFRREWSEVPSL